MEKFQWEPCLWVGRQYIGAYLWLCISKIDEKQNNNYSRGKDLVIVCYLVLLHDFSRFLNLIIITTQLKVEA